MVVVVVVVVVAVVVGWFCWFVGLLVVVKKGQFTGET